MAEPGPAASTDWSTPHRAAAPSDRSCRSCALRRRVAVALAPCPRGQPGARSSRLGLPGMAEDALKAHAGFVTSAHRANGA